MRKRLLLVPLLFSACAPSASDVDVDVGSTGAPIVGTPIEHPTGFVGIPAMVASGSWSDAPYAATGSSSVHGLTYTNGADLASGPIPVATTDPTTWIARARGGSEWANESTPAFDSRLRAAWEAGVGHLANIDESTLDLLKKDLATLGVTVTKKPVAREALGYDPDQVRWLRSQYAPNGKTSTWGPIQQKYEYSSPDVTAAVRQRGARLYCAARRAADVQAANPGSVVMGEQVALPLTIFGTRIDIGVVQATFAIDAPKKFTGGGPGVIAPADGAQAFVVPLLAGIRAIPIRGLPLIPEFPELRHPIALVGGDSQVVSPQANETILDGVIPGFCWFGTCTKPRPSYVSASRKTWETATHADALLTASAGLDWTTGEIPVMTFGFGQVNVAFGADLAIGERQVGNDRVLQPALSTWSPLVRPDLPPTPAAWGMYNDSSWGIDSYHLGTSPTPPYLILMNGGAPWTPSTSSASLLRAYENDDRHIATQSRLGVQASIIARGGAKISVLDLTLQGTGKIEGSIQLKHDLRNGLSQLQTVPSDPSIHPDVYPFDNLLVTPKTSATVTLGLTVTLNIKADFGIKKIDHTVTLLDPKTSKTWGDKPWDEDRRMRLGTGSDYAWAGDLAQQSWSMAHLPNSPTFDSFDRTVDACLADMTTPPSAPPPCPSKPGTGTVPAAQICVVMTPDHSLGFDGGFGTNYEWGPDVCTDPVGRAALMTTDPAVRACYQSLLQYVCSPVSRPLDGITGRSHVLRPDSGSVSTDASLATAMKACLDAFPTWPAGDVINRHMSFAACDATGRLLSKEETFSAEGSSTEPPAVKNGSCL